MCILPLCICSLSITQHMCTYMHAFILFFSLSVFALNVYCSYVQWNVYIIRIKLRICASWLTLVLSLNLLLEIHCFFFILSCSLYVCVFSLKMFYQCCIPLHYIATVLVTKLSPIFFNEKEVANKILASSSI